ncbi:FAD-binding oxidoreductase [Pseudomonas sp. N040]|uniref:FAD-binding oxidoreductase n=1 Tax=Pseudomonas sp. N040 TaxID=2785325 RepID=UPI0018A30237|nr:FAD-binding oxidoreductase [Pseudomonas sp. N040]MBF7729441.1 FAD-binding oxidoreductase [Pseudomonas sp. N040]MBW7013081.1 FAD-binding oxidoreductase [Pseudomonas sp. N040]
MNIAEELRALVGPSGVLEAADVATRSAGVWRADNLKAAALVRPCSTAEVAKVLQWCHTHKVAVVTQGGLTGLVHGADAQSHELILSLERMRNIEVIDPLQRTATVQAGVTLQTLQEAVEQHGLAFPLDLGARGTATLGGNAATNAGGNRVIRYGMTRDMVLGLEVVLADGSVVSSLNTLLKNNTGYDLKQLFIGSEGTLGVITRLVLRLREKPTTRNMALVGLDSFANVAHFLKHMDRSLGGTLSAFEVMWQSFYRLVTSPPAKGKPPIAQDYPFYALVESQGADSALDSQRFNAALESAFEAGILADAAISQSEADCHAFWSLRDDVEQVMHLGAPIVFDISLPIAEMETFAAGLKSALPGLLGKHQLFIFGHLGDGNLHVAVVVEPQAYLTARPVVEAQVYGALAAFRGSVSAEHGIGLEKKPYLSVSRSDSELALMRTLKQALDPLNLLNPGKII